MIFSGRTLAYAAALAVPLSLVHAATPADVAGHWQGAIHAPSGDVPVELDLAVHDGKPTGTFSYPNEHIEGYPLWNAVVDGRSVSLQIKLGGSPTQTFAGSLADDGSSISGDFLMDVYAVPFTFSRAGEAQIEAPPRSPAIDEALAGAWSASLALEEGKPLSFVLTMSNDADGTALGTWAIEDGVPTPVTIEQQGRNVTLASTVTRAEYSGTLNADGTQISGTLEDGTLERPLVFSRTAHAR